MLDTLLSAWSMVVCGIAAGVIAVIWRRTAGERPVVRWGALVACLVITLAALLVSGVTGPAP